MKLILERQQRTSGMMKKTQVFAVKFRAQISQQERDAINRYSLADDVLYESETIVDEGSDLLGLASRVYMNSMIKKVVVRELIEGKTIECGDIVEMKGVEGQVLQAAKNLKVILDTAATFGGREVIEL